MTSDDKLMKWLVELEADERFKTNIHEAEVVKKAAARIREQDAAIAELVEALESVMTWIDNWGPNFSEDEEWTQEDIKIGNLIAKHKAGE